MKNRFIITINSEISYIRQDIGSLFITILEKLKGSGLALNPLATKELGNKLSKEELDFLTSNLGNWHWEVVQYIFNNGPLVIKELTVEKITETVEVILS